ncbi:odorant receptor 13a-like [Bombus pascuorum]|uniref:odorant receptor 13a-like n=1 Tax=Bombus pascuorum TaxID=65598 RepID=UPI00298DF2B6|nr:odorant receptor 13a-like [Bombus pascuorum]
MSNEAVVIEADSNSNSDYSLQLNRWFLKPIGAWPSSPSTTKLERIISFVLNIICFSTVTITVIPSLLLIILDDQSINFKLKALCFVSHWIISSVNYTALLLHSKDIRQCIEHMESDWRTVIREEDQHVMLKNAKFGRFVAAFCAIFMQGSVLSFCFVTALNTVEIQIGNETRVLHVLPCAVYKKLVNVDESSTNQIMFFLQVSSAIIANSSTIGIFSFAAVLAAHACGQLNVVRLWITEFVNEASGKKKSDGSIQIGAIVERHLRTLNFISYIEDIMNKLCLLEMLRCTTDICVTGYYILSEWAEHDIQNLTSYFMMLVTMCYNIFIICYIGEILTEQCKKIGEVVYMTNWYYLPGKTILDLIMVIARSNVVVQITAGKLVHMSVYTFGSVIKTAFAYLNMLQQMTK